MDEVDKIINSIKQGIIKPIYFLTGEVPYYIDKISDYIENNLLEEHERDFNQTIYYGRDVKIEDIIATAKRFPMMAERQVVIVKEAQDLEKSIEKLENYLQNLQESTVLVFAYKYKTLDKRKKITKLIEKSGVFFECKKLYENQLATVINRMLSEKGYAIEPKAAAMLVEFLGDDLNKISNELNKLQIILPQSHKITPSDIEINIGISKDFNNFEFIKALGEKNELKAYKITKYFADNKEKNPLPLTISTVFNFFVKLLKYHGLKDKNPNNVAKMLEINPYFLKDYDVAMRNFPMKKVSAIISKLRDVDIKSKGVGANNLPQHDLLKELLVVIFS